MDRLTLLMLHATLRLGDAFAAAHRPRRRDDRGDVPGWVMVVVMTAGICAVLYALAKNQLTQMLQTALGEVR